MQIQPVADDEPTRPTGQSTRSTEPTRPAVVANSRGPRSIWSLAVVHCPDPSAPRELPIRDTVSLGRSSRSRLTQVIDDGRMSRKHVEFRRMRQQNDTHVVVRDLGSLNGTFVGGQRIDRRRLEEGQVVRVGDTIMVLHRVSREHLQESRVSFVVNSDLVGSSPVFEAIRQHVRRASPSDLPVLLLGETGTGKEVVAQAIHKSSRQRGPFVALNCAAIPPTLIESYLFGHKRGAFTGATSDAKGYFRQAHGGTLFLDEVGDLPLDQQPKLLRVLETGTFTPVGATRPESATVRVIAATNANVTAGIQRGTFRSDLYARLAGYVIELPPLRERREDILELARVFLRDTGRDFRFTAEFVERILGYDWPLNVRELRLAIARVVLLEDSVTTLGIEHLDLLIDERLAKATAGAAMASAVASTAAVAPPPTAAAASAPSTPAGAKPSPRLQRPSEEDLTTLLRAHEGNVTRIAREFDKDPKQIYRWLRAYGLDPANFRSESA